ncbi:hypothetical protein BJ170DRAFT_735602 [Xylariales sp. AK1849]|nr:hypothetical protein BJ170DRAFT_735602 [Xylariales sp. AK1849]
MVLKAGARVAIDLPPGCSSTCADCTYDFETMAEQQTGNGFSFTIPTCPTLTSSAAYPEMSARFRRVENSCLRSQVHMQFSSPPGLDPNHLSSLAKPRFDESTDHLRQLQCNAACMRRMSRPCLGIRDGICRRTSEIPLLFVDHNRNKSSATLSDAGFILSANGSNKWNQKGNWNEDGPLAWCLMQMQPPGGSEGFYDHSLHFAYLHDYLTRSPFSLATGNLINKVLASEAEGQVAWKTMRPDRRPGGVPSPFLYHERVAKSSLENFNIADATDWHEEQEMAVSIMFDSRSLGKFSIFDGTDHDLALQGIIDVITADSTLEYREAIRVQEAGTLDAIEILEVSLLPQLSLEVEFGSRKVLNIQESRLTRRGVRTCQGCRGDGILTLTRQPAASDRGHAESYEAHQSHVSMKYSRSCLGVSWDEIVYGMSDTGFTARNIGGSAAWLECSGEGQIIFHRPHPALKVDPVMLYGAGVRAVYAEFIGRFRKLNGLFQF